MPSTSLLTLATALAGSICVSARDMNLKLFDTSVYPNALCNDGTPSGYYFSPSPSSPPSNSWLVFQEGGGWCFDKESCLSRASALISSKTWAQSIHDMGGIFNSTNPTLANMNVVYAPYCSSDGWAGDISAADTPFSFHFRGHSIVTAIFLDLIATHNMGSAQGTQVLYGGCSAGARGALFNLDRVHSLIEQSIPSTGSLTNFGGLLDSAFWVDILPANPSIVSLMQQVRLMQPLTNATASITPPCLAANPGSDSWKCLVGEYAVPFLTSNYILHSFQYDSFQLTSDFGSTNVPDKTPAELAYDESFRNLTRSSAFSDTITPARQGTAALLPGCYKHCATQESSFYTLATNGVTLQDAIVSWFVGNSEGTAAVPAYVVDDCKGFNCGADCPSV